MPIVQARGGSVRKAKKITVKTSLNNPYIIKWHTLERDDMHFILQTLEESIKHIGLKKIETQRRKKRSIAKRQIKEKCDASDFSVLPKEKEIDHIQQKQGWTDLNVRKQLAIGINEVTRSLEKNELLLVLVCKSAKPTMITMHLIQLSASRAVPAGQVPRLSESIAPMLGLTSVLALGFKKNSDTFTEVVEAIIPRIPSLNVPWIHHRSEQHMAEAYTDPLEIQDTELMQTSVEEFSQSHKWKCTESNKSDSSNVTLQALRIKKLVPNPNKIRKPPKNKKAASK
ncbi:ribonuclease P protein subunit p38 isoform X2 [Mauremys reevesii]|nr:ribonuclease P protein subunit p38 isoform X2 [Mauremys reevesii]XP_039378438.1 ribonuclease P protein subunit p38 isoform X2 [Mauremys reevesii]XP_039378439.1 ribonuclease P protein subunit p38 isoform X2 [Mauremys reevesii]XP_039378440.1 ribonuclease P protein subunit p38 isoform X2 [Mauremys reevesii]XP_039378441.1 ribonuclease P protein subunit p38 isoform X2 [Mauremys reevesii]XP_039378442.1 ribonuclease P protein subunit p38 isoform X2 [Mauremys reevesii]XP_039378444.1 ribonuclease P